MPEGLSQEVRQIVSPEVLEAYYAVSTPAYGGHFDEQLRALKDIAGRSDLPLEFRTAVECEIASIYQAKQDAPGAIAQLEAIKHLRSDEAGEEVRFYADAERAWMIVMLAMQDKGTTQDAEEAVGRLLSEYSPYRSETIEVLLLMAEHFNYRLERSNDLEADSAKLRFYTETAQMTIDALDSDPSLGVSALTLKALPHLRSRVQERGNVFRTRIEQKKGERSRQLDLQVEASFAGMLSDGEASPTSFHSDSAKVEEASRPIAAMSHSVAIETRRSVPERPSSERGPQHDQKHSRMVLGALGALMAAILCVACSLVVLRRRTPARRD